MIDNHLAGHRQKTRRRLRIMEDFGYQQEIDARPPAPSASSSEALGMIQRSVTPSQWQCLEGLANGDSYGQLAGPPRIALKAQLNPLSADFASDYAL